MPDLEAFHADGPKGVVLIDATIHGDDRGFFMESFNQRRFNDLTGRQITFVQDNHSRSDYHVLRGLHYQLPPYAQGKLVRVVIGSILDVAVDLRRSSATFGKWSSAHLSAENKKALWIPEGFAHGFVTLSDHADVIYKATAYYTPQCERTIAWDDPDLNINWEGIETPILSERDTLGCAFRDASLFE